MEIFRQCGAEDDVRAAGLPHDSVRFVVWTESLAGRELERRPSARLRPGVARIGPVLVRPDAHAGWRARSGAADHQGSAIRHALGSILGRP
jgi:hypothetical protein